MVEYGGKEPQEMIGKGREGYIKQDKARYINKEKEKRKANI